MTDPNKQDNGVEQTSRLTRNPRGTFTNLIRNEIRSVPSQSSQSSETSIEKVSGTNLEQIELRSRLLGRIDSVLLIAPHVKKSLSGKFIKEFTATLERINELKNEIGGGKPLSDDIETEVQDAVHLISEIIGRGDEHTRREGEEKQRELLDVAYEYRERVKYYNDVIEVLRESDSALLVNKDTILSTIDELAWLQDDSTIIHKSNTGVLAIDVREKVKKLAKDLETISTTTDNLEDMENLLSDLLKLEKEADGLRILDRRLLSLRDSLKERAALVVSRFKERQSKKNFTTLESLRDEYTELVEKMKGVEVKLPHVLSGPKKEEEPKIPEPKSTTSNSTPATPLQAPTPAVQAPQTPDPKVPDAQTPLITPEDQTPTVSDPQPATTTTTTQGAQPEPPTADPQKNAPVTLPSGREAKDIDLPRITRNRKSRGSYTKYIIEKADGTWEIVPRVFWGTLNRFRKVFDNEDYKDKDFTLAVTLKEEVLDAIDAIDFDLADKKAQALGKELDSIESKDTTASTTPDQNPDQSVNEPPKNPGDVDGDDFERATIKDIQFNLPFRIENGVPQVKVNGEYKNIPRRVNFFLHQYLNIINDPHNKDKDFTAATELKDAVRKCIEEGNFGEASKNAQKLGVELDALSGVESTDKVKINNPPVGQIVSIITKGRHTPEDIKRQKETGRTHKQEMVIDLLAWKKRWVDSGEIDNFREKHSKINISKEQIASTKLLFKTYVDILRRGTDSGLPEGLVRSAYQNCILCAKILAGIHHETASDIKYFVDNYNEEEDLELFKNLQAEIEETEAIKIKGPTKLTTLRPTLSGATLSPQLEKIAVNKNFELQKTVFNYANTLLEKIVPLLNSELEKQAFVRIAGELKALQETVAANPTREAVALFAAKVERLVKELSRKATFISAQYGDILSELPIPTSNIPADTTIIRSKRLRGDSEKTEKVAAWQARQNLQGSAEDLQKSAEKKYQQELTTKHEEMFARDPVMYNHVYGTENTARDEKTAQVAAKTLEGKTPKTPKERLVELNNEMDQLKAQWKKLHEDIAHGTAFGNPEGEKRVLQAKIELLDERIQSYTKIVLEQITHPDKKYSSLETGKQAYNPELDPSLNDSARGEYVQNKDGTVSALNRTMLSQEEIAKIAATSGFTKDAVGNVVPVDFSKLTPEELQAREGTFGELRKSLHPNHVNGMVSTVTEDEARRLAGANFQPEKPYEVSDLQTAQAFYNEDRKKLLENQPATQETKEKRHTFVNKVSNWLFGYPSTKKFKWGFLAAGLTGFAVASGAFASEKSPETENTQRIENPRTIADVIKQKPDLKKALSGIVPDKLLSVIGNSQLNNKDAFDELLKISAQEFNINPSNPSLRVKIRDLNCKMVYDIEGAGQGITKDQQNEASAIIRNLQIIFNFIETNDESMLFTNDIRLFDDKDTIYTFYEKVRAAASTYNNERDKLNKI